MATQIEIILLKDFSLLGKAGEVATVQLDYAKNYLFPNGIAKKIKAEDVEKIIYEKKRQKREEQKKNSGTVKSSLYVFNNPDNAYVSKRNQLGRIPPLTFRIKMREDIREKISWKWYPTNRLNNLPAGDRYVIIHYRGKSYFSTYNYLQKLRLRNCHSPLIVDGSNLGWKDGKPATDPIFYLYDYIADKSEKFFFPLIWTFDKSFRRKLTKTEKRELKEFCSWSGTIIVDYADKEIFKLAKKYRTRFIFSMDHFKEYHTENFTRITFR